MADFIRYCAAGPLARGVVSDAGRLLRLSLVCSAAPADIRASIDGYLRGLHSGGAEPVLPVDKAVFSALCSAERSGTDIHNLDQMLQFLRSLVPTVPDTAPLMKAKASSILSDWTSLQPAGRLMPRVYAKRCEVGTAVSRSPRLA
jgi:hypothetical protein